MAKPVHVVVAVALVPPVFPLPVTMRTCVFRPGGVTRIARPVGLRMGRIIGSSP